MNIDGIFKQFEKLDKDLAKYIEKKDKEIAKIAKDKQEYYDLYAELAKAFQVLMGHIKNMVDKDLDKLRADHKKAFDDVAMSEKLQAKVREILV